MTENAAGRDKRAIVVFERQPFWEPELRRQFAGEDVAIRGCRTVGDLDDYTHHTPTSVAVVNLDDAAVELVRWLSWRLTDGRPTPTIALARDAMTALEWRLREAGAVAVVNEFISGHRLARLCRRQWPPAVAAPPESPSRL